MTIATFELSYSGSYADRSEINFYDVAEALLGFQRSLALTVHLVLNDEIITQAPALKGATIFALPPKRGSWMFVAGISLVSTGLYKLGTAPKDTVIGHIVASVCDYVVSHTLGFHVDFDKTLGQQYFEVNDSAAKIPHLTQNRLDSLTEKCQGPIKNMHRPISAARTANVAHLTSSVGNERRPIGQPLTMETYKHIADATRSDEPEVLVGRISSYNSNTYKGRVFVPARGRPIPFELIGSARTESSVRLITGSLSANALRATNVEAGYLRLECCARVSKSGVVRALEVVDVLGK